jgi:hypothetical protein
MKKFKKYFSIFTIVCLVVVIILVIANRNPIYKIFPGKCEMKKISYELETDCIYLYNKGKKIEDSDYKSFKKLEVPYNYYHPSPASVVLFFVDKNNIYIMDSGDASLAMSSASLLVRPNYLHMPSLEFLEYMYAKDKNYVYYNFNIIQRADTKTFVIEHGTLPSNATYLSKDKDSYFYLGQVVY